MKKETKKKIDAVLFLIGSILYVFIAFATYCETEDQMLMSIYICLALVFLACAIRCFIKSRKL